MFELLSAPATMPFAVALSAMLMLAALEAVGMMFGAGLSDIIGSMLPDIDADMDIDIDGDFDGDYSGLDLGSHGVITRAMLWMRVGDVPILVLLVIFLTAFGLIGLAVQQALQATFGFMLPAIIASAIAFTASIPATRIFGGIIGRIIPKDETEAVSQKTFVGKVAVITLGLSAKDNPAQAKVQDAFNMSHYIMVEPDNNNDEFSQGEEVLLVRKSGSIFYAIENSNISMSDEVSA